MELLRKTENMSDDPRMDNADKAQLFGEGRRPQAAAQIREEWLMGFWLRQNPI